MKPKVSIITIHRNNLAYLEKWGQALKENTSYHNLEVLLVDNASEPSCSEQVIKIVKQMNPIHGTVFFSSTMKSFAENCNIGAYMATGDYICFLNDDTEVQKGWLTEMVETMERNKDCAIVGAKMWFPNQMIQHCGVAFHSNKMPGHIWWNQIHKDDERIQKEREFQVVTGGCMLVDVSIFKKTGCFDTIFEGAGYEDVDLCLRFRASGHKIYYSPKAGVIHHEKVTQNKCNPQIRQAYHIKNTETFLKRWADKIVPDYHLFEPGVY